MSIISILFASNYSIIPWVSRAKALFFWVIYFLHFSLHYFRVCWQFILNPTPRGLSAGSLDSAVKPRNVGLTRFVEQLSTDPNFLFFFPSKIFVGVVGLHSIYMFNYRILRIKCWHWGIIFVDLTLFLQFALSKPSFLRNLLIFI